ncbi:MAG: ASCH domain-containing protein [Asticcacaulis sp.]
MQRLPRLALSVRQPWAWAIGSEGKIIENRTWATKVRGSICIHAAKGMTRDEYDACMDFISDAFPLPKAEDMCRRARFVNNDHRGGIIATADLVDCVTTYDSPWMFGPYGFVLSNIQPVPFLSVRGGLGFFDWRKNLKGGAG